MRIFNTFYRAGSRTLYNEPRAEDISVSGCINFRLSCIAVGV